MALNQKRWSYYWTFNTSYAPFAPPKTIESKSAAPPQLERSPLGSNENATGSAPSGSAPAAKTGTAELMTPLCAAGCSTGPALLKLRLLHSSGATRDGRVAFGG